MEYSSSHLPETSPASGGGGGGLLARFFSEFGRKPLRTSCSKPESDLSVGKKSMQVSFHEISEVAAVKLVSAAAERGEEEGMKLEEVRVEEEEVGFLNKSELRVKEFESKYLEVEEVM